MKTVLAALFLLATSMTYLSGQFSAGVQAGLSTFSIDDEKIQILDDQGRDDFTLLLEQGEYGYHLGVWTQIQLGTFIIRPELVFNSNRATFRIFDQDDPDIMDQVLEEKYQYLDLPVMLGVKTGILRINAGPVAHVFLNSTSDLFDFADYEENFSAVTFGYQAGVGVDIWKFNVDLRYEGNFTNFGSHLTFSGRDYEFSNRPNRLIGSVGYRF